MILSDKRIMEEMEKGTIKIEPYDRADLWAAIPMMFILVPGWLHTGSIFWMPKNTMKLSHFEIPEEGFVLYPHIFYLGVTAEYTETHEHVPFLEGKSSTGRLGIDIHATAGKGDVGFVETGRLKFPLNNRFEFIKGMPIGQLIYFPVDGEIEVKYNQKKDAKYSGQTNKPVESMMWKNKF